MKKILVMLLFSFSVIAYAAPPPVVDVIADQVQYVVQDDFQIAEVFAQEVAYVYTGDTLLYSCQLITAEMEQKLEFPELVLNDELYAQVDELNRPPADTEYAELLTDKQNSNFGYPLTAN